MNGWQKDVSHNCENGPKRRKPDQGKRCLKWEQEITLHHWVQCTFHWESLESPQGAARIGYLRHSSALKDLQTVKYHGFLIPGNAQGHLGWGLEQPGLVEGWNQVVPNNSMILWNVKPPAPASKHTKAWLCLQATTGVLLVSGLSSSDLQEVQSHSAGCLGPHVHFYLMIIPENISCNSSTVQEQYKYSRILKSPTIFNRQKNGRM